MRLSTRFNWLNRITNRMRRNSAVQPQRKLRFNMLRLEDRITPDTFTVSLTGQAGTVDPLDPTMKSGDIRYCVNQANASAGADEIVFSNSNGAFTTPQKITLTSTLALSGSTKIDAVAVGGKNQVSISGGNTVAVFSIAGANLAEFYNITITEGKSTTGGSASGGGAVAPLATTSSVTFDNCIVSNNINSANGGAVNLLSGYVGLVTINNSVFSGNQAPAGGCLYFYTSGNLTVSGSTFTGNKTTSGTGGAFYIYSGSATIGTSTFTNNTSASSGGAITINNTAPVSITECVFTGNSATVGGAVNRSGGTGATTISKSTFSGNSATSSGGGLTLSGASNTTIDSCTFSGNSAPLGGGINQSSGTITLTNSAVTGNNATSTTGGGINSSATFTAKYCEISNNVALTSGGGLATSGVTTLTNTTVAKNTARGSATTGGGGGIFFSASTVTLNNTTVAYNSATDAIGGLGGGLRTTAGTLALSSSLIAKNTATAGGPDIFYTTVPGAAVDAMNSFLGDLTGSNSNFTGGTYLSGNPNLSSVLLPHGTTNVPATNTLALLFGSTAIDAGNNNLVLSNDQRGSGFTRTNGTADVGAFESGSGNADVLDVSGPSISIANLGQTSFTVSVEYFSSNGINTGTIDNTDLAVSNQFGLSATPLGAPTVTVNSANDVVAVYKFAPPGGDWTADDKGTYAIKVTGVVSDLAANNVAAKTYTTFRANFGSVSLTVDNSGDVDDGNYAASQLTLREAINYANSDTGNSDSVGFSGVSLINLTANLPTLIVPLTVNGPGAGSLTIAGKGFRMFNSTAAAGSALSISGMTLSGASGATGSAITAGAGVNLTVANIAFKSNSAAGAGGAVAVATGTTSISNSTFTLNTATGAGGAVAQTGAGALTITSSTFNGNVASSSGGAINIASGTATITGSNFGTAAPADRNKGTSGGAINSAATVTINSSSFVNNQATSTTGGAIASSNSLSLTGSSFTGNIATTAGGAVNSSSSLTVNTTSFSSNTATTTGGAINSSATAAATITESSFGSNSATTSGGGISWTGAGSLTVNRSSIFGGTSALGGGINQSTGTITFTNSTVSGNTATGTTGGGGWNVSGGNQNIISSTLAFNNATGTGSSGGGFRRSAGTLVINSSIIAKNTSKTGGIDAHSTATVSLAGNDSFIGDLTSSSITLTGTFYNGDPKVAPLTTKYGGTTPYHPLQFGSPAVNKGNDTGALGVDQRNVARPVGAGFDIGSFEGEVADPVATATLLPNVPPINATYVATVTYTDNTGINTGGIDLNDVRLTGPGYALPAAPISKNITMGMNGDKSVTVDYTFNPPNGAWDWTVSGTYQIVMQDNQVYDTEGVPGNPVAGGVFGTFNVNIAPPTNLVVDNNSDVVNTNFGAGDFTLREALNIANGTVGTTETITFAPALNGKSIVLGAFLNISDPLVITGPGAGNLSVSGNNAVRLFQVSGNILATFNSISLINGLSTTGGSGGGGAAVFPSSTGTSVTFNDCIVSGHKNSSTGGAISLLSGFTGKITINNSTFSGNSSTRGGSIYFWTTGNLAISNSVFSSNTSTGGGGAINAWSALTTIDGSTFKNNTAAGSGGAIENNGSATMTITNSTISGNTAGLGGGVYQYSTSLTVTNSTVSGNTATGTAGGGGIAVGSATTTINNTTITNNNASGAGATGGGIRKTSATGTLTLSSTIVAGNTASSGGPDIHGTVALAIAGGDNLVGVADLGGFTLAGTNQTGDSITPLNPMLGALKNNGGSTETHALLSGSPALGKGNNNLTLLYDQRGKGYDRSFAGITDVGAVAGDPTVPLGSGTGPTIGAVSMSDQTITVTYTVPIGTLDASTFDDSDIIVTGPFGYSKAAKLVGGPYMNASTVMVQYKVPPNDNNVVGSWDAKDAGLYTINLQANQIKTLAGGVAAAGNIGNFRVAIAQSFLVDNILTDTDDLNYGVNELTLREALKLSNDNKFATDTITFNASVFPMGTVINLAAEMGISDSVVIVGPGVDNLSVNGIGTYRVFNVDDATATAINVSMSNLTVTGGADGTKGGGGIRVNAENLTLTDVAVTSNSTSGGVSGGGIGLTGKATLTATRVLISGNNSSGNGGGIDGGPGGATISLTDCSIEGNFAVNTGAGISNGDVVMTLDRTTVSGNTATSGTSKGGGISSYAGQISIVNSTISGNQANEGGGIALISSAKTLSVRHTTITGNYAVGGNGGGIRRVSGTATIDVFSSAITGNTGATSADISSGGTVNVNYSAIFSNAGFTLTGANNLGFGTNAKLGTLQKNPISALTKTHLPDQGSPLFNAGPNATTISFDQRGMGFNRLLQGRVDIGSVEDTNLLPTAAMKSIPTISTKGNTPDSVTIVYTDNSKVLASTIKSANIAILDPYSNPLALGTVTLTPNMDAPSISAEYKFTIPGGGWDKADNGTYTVRLLAADSVTDDSTNPVVTVDTDIGTFVVAVPAEYVVDEATDKDDTFVGPGQLSLREALLMAKTDGVPSKITFDPMVFPPLGSTTIPMTTLNTEMFIEEDFDLSIVGPGSKALTIDATGNGSRIFTINATGTFTKVNISGMTIKGGSTTTNGGGITMGDDDVTLTDVTVTGNTTTVEGGGINISTASGKLTLINSTISNNMATGGDAGGVNFNTTATSAADQVFTVIRSTISGNSASDDGGGMYFFSGGTLTMDGSTVSGNTAGGSGDGGGAYLYGTVATISNSTWSGNSAPANGGGIATLTSTNLTIRNSTLAFNTAGAGGGGNIGKRSTDTPTVSLYSTIVAKGTAAGAPDINVTVNTATFTLVGDVSGGSLPADPTNITGVDPLLDPLLAPNGAPAGAPLTHALMSSMSPAVDKGDNSSKLPTDQRGSSRTSNFPAIANAGDGTDIGAFELQAPAALPPTITGFKVSDGSGQRSMVQSMTITFSEAVMVSAGAFQLDRVANGSAGSVNLVATPSGNSIVLTFVTGGTVGVDPAGSLLDGTYKLFVNATKISGVGGTLDGNGNGTAEGSPADDKTYGVHRLFGDSTGDGAVTADDFADFRRTFGVFDPTYGARFDYFGNAGTPPIGSNEFAEFRKRFGLNGYQP